MKNILVCFIAILVSACAASSSTKLMQDAPQFNTLVLQIAKKTPEVHYKRNKHRTTSNEEYEKAAIDAVVTLFKTLEKEIPNHMNGTLEKRSGPIKVINKHNFSEVSGEAALLVVEVKELLVLCDTRAGCATSDGLFKVQLEWKKQLVWESHVKFTGSISASGKSFTTGLVKRLSKKITKGLIDDGVI